MEWSCKHFEELSAAELYAIVALRERVFVVEQRCVYLDADGYDVGARHLRAVRDGELLAYLRVLSAGAKYREVSLGRIVTAPELRGSGLGRELVRRGLALIDGERGGAIRIGAQCYLERFYAEFGFVRASPDYEEDGIPHLEMIRAAVS
jgi:ElaA protein